MSSCSASMSEVMRGDEPAGLLPLEEVHRQRHEVPEHAHRAGRAGTAPRCGATSRITSRPITSPSDRDDEVHDAATVRARRASPSRDPRRCRDRRARARRAGTPVWPTSTTVDERRSRPGTAAASAAAAAPPAAPARASASLRVPRRPSAPALSRPSAARCRSSSAASASDRGLAAVDLGAREHLAVRAPTSRAARRACPRRRPCRSSSSTTRSASAIVAGRWAMMIVVRPSITSASAARISCSLVGSTDEVASSRIRTRGSASTARAIAMRWRWPPESEKPCSPITVS